jgi:hypothetical protein
VQPGPGLLDPEAHTGNERCGDHIAAHVMQQKAQHFCHHAPWFTGSKPSNDGFF